MVRNTIRSIILFSIVFLTFNIIGCTGEKKALNQSIILTEDVKSDTEPELKVISTKIIPLENHIKDFSNIYIEREDGSTLIRQNYVNGYLMNSINVKIDGDKATSEYKKSISDEYRNINKTFYLNSLDNNKVLIIDGYSENTFKTEESLINNEQSRYELSGEYLIEIMNDTTINNITNDYISWTNLKTSSSGRIKMPEELSFILQCNVVGDRLFLSAISTLAIEALNGEVGIEDTYMYTYSNPDTLLVIDLTTNKLIEKNTIGSFRNFHVINDEIIIFTSCKDSEEVVEMYNLNNKTRKEFMKYSTKQGEGLITLKGLNLFPSKDKIYYCEDDGEKVSLKIAEINGMDIENSITAYEADKNELEEFYISNISVSNDEREIKVFNRTLSEYGFVIDKIIKIKLNK
ncbi:MULTISPECIES: hypothetical protein [unclassified Clostridium]|uniref:hypothetical protein n=1 Tax=unclassified Clostridium TaxID=2614128 RepID=UPI001C8B464F|nr:MULTISPECIES: hypothetical protein [unclassified Clostridium]MBX9136796.1 hypothetical protein [Clostridium sp. K12(2020)]MBX9143606.1 hypothetical protein [Clostridium sp. K13]MDU2289635.1 hypothetical protein [Clostridium celatum]